MCRKPEDKGLNMPFLILLCQFFKLFHPFFYMEGPIRLSLEYALVVKHMLSTSCPLKKS